MAVFLFFVGRASFDKVNLGQPSSMVSGLGVSS